MNAHGAAVGGDIKQDIVQNFPAGFKRCELYRRPQINRLRQGRQKAVHQRKPAAIAQQAARPCSRQCIKIHPRGGKIGGGFYLLVEDETRRARQDRALVGNIRRPDFNFAEVNLLKAAGHL